MANEQLTIWNTVENRKENWFLSQLKNLKHTIELTATLSLAPIAVTWQTTADTTKVENNKTQIEVVQQDTDPVKDLMKKHNINTISDLDNIEKVQDLLNIRDDMLIVLKDNPKLETDPNFIAFHDELKFNIEALAPTWFDLKSRKAPSWSTNISDEEKKIDEQIAQKQNEINTLKNDITTIKRQTAEVKKIITWLTWEKE